MGDPQFDFPSGSGDKFNLTFSYATDGKTPAEREIERDYLRLKVTSENLRKSVVAKLNGKP